MRGIKNSQLLRQTPIAVAAEIADVAVESLGVAFRALAHPEHGVLRIMTFNIDTVIYSKQKSIPGKADFCARLVSMAGVSLLVLQEVSPFMLDELQEVFATELPGWRI